MRIGVVLPHMGPWAGADAIASVAAFAEESGFDSVWAMERTLYPLEPRSAYPLGDLPDAFRSALDPVDSLVFAAAHTSRVRLGTSVLNLPWYNPVLLARRLTTLDVLSRGRLQVGFGQGWSQDEYEAAGVPWRGRGARFEEALEVLRRIWTENPVEFRGRFFTVPRSLIGPKPVQQPHPPIYIGGYTDAALARVARLADGWNPVGVPLAEVERRYLWIRETAERAGRDPASVGLVVRANVKVSGRPLPEPREDFTGAVEQIASDIETAGRIGASEVIVDVTFDPAVRTADEFVERLAPFAALVQAAHA